MFSYETCSNHTDERIQNGGGRVEFDMDIAHSMLFVSTLFLLLIGWLIHQYDRLRPKRY